MATKVQIKNGKFTTRGGLYFIEDQYSRLFRQIITEKLGRRGETAQAYQYSDLLSALTMVYFGGGECLEDVMTIGNDLMLRPGSRIPSSDTIARGLKDLAEENISYTSGKDITYQFNKAEKLNGLMLDMLFKTGQLSTNQHITLDFDHEVIATEKEDALFSYKKKRAYFPGCATCGEMIVGVENRDGNTNVKFKQAETLKRFFDRLRERKIVIDWYRADCGSFSEDIVTTVCESCTHFLLRASNCQKRREMYQEHKDWETIKIGEQTMEVASFDFDDFLPEMHLRLVVQRQKIDLHDGVQDIFGQQYVYRSILTDERTMSEKEIIEFYNARGASERNFDVQNNDFGWAHLPFSKMAQNTVFLLVTAMAKNFYLYILDKLCKMRVEGLKPGSRMKKLWFHFIYVPAKWVRRARTYILNIYTTKPYDMYMSKLE